MTCCPEEGSCAREVDCKNRTPFLSEHRSGSYRYDRAALVDFSKDLSAGFLAAVFGSEQRSMSAFIRPLIAKGEGAGQQRGRAEPL